MTVPQARRAAVLGHPVAHSLSPVLHRAAYAALGLEGWEYSVIDAVEEDLPGFVDALDGTWAGLSLTMPLKQAIIPLLDHIEPLAEVVGAVNTVVIQAVAGSRLSLVGANTDVYGLVAALREGLEPGGRATPPSSVETAVVLGAGATAASTLAALAQLGCTEPTVLVRSLGRTGGLQRAAHRMGVSPRFALLGGSIDVLQAADVVVSTLPSGGADPVAERLAGAAVRGVLLDAVYYPRPTPLSVAWESAGGVAVAGERMLLHQAVEQVRLMTGLAAPVRAMDDALGAALGEPSQARA